MTIATGNARLNGSGVRVVVVCDACSDRTVHIVRRAGYEAIEIQARNVGIARAIGADRVMAGGAQWLAFTDADTKVSPQWLLAQLALRSAAVCGTIGVDDWSPYDDAMRAHFEESYTDADGHRHIHGANLGVAVDAYRQVGGFAALKSSEDVALIDALVAAGIDVSWSAAPRVTTSVRRAYRAPEGFGATLARVAERFTSGERRVKSAGLLPDLGLTAS
jgi:glycosyltransferase involved in cell wall biosynthesis